MIVLLYKTRKTAKIILASKREPVGSRILGLGVFGSHRGGLACFGASLLLSPRPPCGLSACAAVLAIVRFGACVLRGTAAARGTVGGSRCVGEGWLVVSRVRRRNVERKRGVRALAGTGQWATAQAPKRPGRSGATGARGNLRDAVVESARARPFRFDWAAARPTPRREEVGRLAA